LTKTSQQRNLCSFAYTFAQIAGQTIFARITDSTTPDQFMVAQQNLLALCQRQQQLISREGAVIDLEERAQTSSEETDVGTEDSPFDDWENQ
jgi:hypothetical protein